MVYNNNIQKERGKEMSKETLENLKETNEGRKVKMKKMLRNKKRNYARSIGGNDSSTFNISRSKYKFNIR